MLTLNEVADEKYEKYILTDSHHYLTSKHDNKLIEPHIFCSKHINLWPCTGLKTNSRLL